MAAYPWGGSEELWWLSARELLSRGIKVSALYPRQRGWHSKLETLGLEGGEVTAYGCSSSRFNGWAGKVAGLVRGSESASPWPARGNWRKADLVVVSQGGISDGLSWLEYLAHLEIPYAIVVQANMVAGWPGDRQADRLRKLYGQARRVYFVSEDNARLFRIQVGYDRANIEVVWNPMNEETPRAPLPWPVVSEKLRLAMVGRVEPFAKAHDLALEAMADSRVRSLPVELEIFGSGPWEQTCSEVIRSMSLSSVKMSGVAKPSEIWQDRHVMLLPSRHEGKSLAMLEALWLGRPVVATAVAGAIEEVVDGRNGLLLREQTGTALADLIVQLWESRDLLPAMGRHSAEYLRGRMPPCPAVAMADVLVELTKEPCSSL